MWDSYEYDELVNLLSDYHKDVFGYRLRLNGNPKDDIIYELNKLDAYMERMRSSAEGRAQLKEEGWYFEDDQNSTQEL